MNVLERPITYAPFLEQLRSAPTRVLLLDYDGTLAPFCVDRTLAFPYPQVPPLIVRIMQTGTRVVLVSRRHVLQNKALLIRLAQTEEPVWRALELFGIAAALMSATSSHRLRLPSALVWASSSTRTTSALLAMTASASISGKP